MDTPLQLDPVLDLRAASPLHALLLLRRGHPLEVDASQVKRLGGGCLQVLLSAQATWRRDGVPFVVTAASESFQQALALFGASDRFADPQLIEASAP